MSRSLILLVFLTGTVPLAAHGLEEKESLAGLESVHLRTAISAYPIDPEPLYRILEDDLASAGVQVTSESESGIADVPFLRLTYGVETKTLDGRPVFLYWVSLELVQAVSWTWTTDPPPLSDEGFAVTWSAFRTDVASDPETATSEIEKQVGSLGDELAADIQKANPVWVLSCTGMETQRPKRRPKPELLP